MRILFFSAVVLSAALFLFLPVRAEEGVAAPWDYTGAHSAAHWGGVCESGRAQSPVNIARFLQEDDLPVLEAAYAAAPLVIVNNGHTVQVDFEGGAGGSFVLEGTKYTLLQAHFHTPSEHYFDGAPYPMEAHFVHRADDGRLAVLAVLIKIGAHHPEIEKIWRNVPPFDETLRPDGVQIMPTALMPESRKTYRYEGSLTTPPCTEGVHWFVLQDSIEVSEEQLRAFQSVFPVNARPVQALQGRMITGD